ncbi:MAG: diadenylate cyclase CdaA [Bacteroidales bacterium]|nr:diadenylate cyclase CdaA [Bacteroidales bacterium]
MGFLDFGFVDLIDILLSAYLLYFLYIKLRNTTAMNILVGLFIVYALWMLVKALDMSLMNTIMSKVASVGMLALVIVFQQEIRKFLLDVGNTSTLKKIFSLENIFKNVIRKSPEELDIPEIVKACQEFARESTGALIVLPNHSDLSSIIATGEKLDCAITSRLLGSLFFKNSPLHDGAVIIVRGRIVAAKCILPLTENTNIPSNIGTRHRSAIGMSEASDSLVVVVSEERGEISYCEYGSICQDVTLEQLSDKLKERFAVTDGNIVTTNSNLVNKFINFLKV